MSSFIISKKGCSSEFRWEFTRGDVNFGKNKHQEDVTNKHGDFMILLADMVTRLVHRQTMRFHGVDWDLVT